MPRSAESDANRSTALDFLRLAGVEGRPSEAYARHVADDFRHHNPAFPAGREALLAGMEAAAKDAPLRSLDVKHVLADGDLVAVHSRIRLAAKDQELAVVHLFRFAHGKIAEFWDVVQALPADSPNRDGAF